MSSESGSPRCLNCGAELTGPYCAQCGQGDTELRISLKRLARDFMAEQLGLESKVPTTLWRLITKPGLLTQEYLAGRRVRSLLPLRLYLSASVVYFLLLSLPIFGSAWKTNIKVTDSDRAAVDSAAQVDGVVVKSKGSNPAITFGGIDRKKITAGSSNGRLSKFVRARMKRFDGMSTPDVIRLFNAAFVRYMPNAVFLLLPVFTVILYLLYRRTGRFFAEHLIFTLHVHAFAFVALMLSLITPAALDWIAPVWILVYLYLAQKRVYRESGKRTALKFAVLLFSYMLIFQITMLTVLGVIFATV